MAATDSEKVRLLVVDDDTSFRMVLSMALADAEVLEGWRAGTVLDDAVALHADAVVVDRRLPDGDGLDAIRALRADTATAELPIIMVTADDDPALRERAFAAGADEHIVKPIDADRVLALVRAIRATPIGERRLRRTIRRARLHVGRDDGGHDDLIGAQVATDTAPEPGGRRRRRGGRGRGKDKGPAANPG